MPAPGETWNQFELVKTLGSGGMGEVFLAEDKKLDRKVALKFLPESLRESTTARERFFREAKSAARLDHPYICKIFEVGDVKGTPYIAMEYVEGTTLKDRLKAGRMHLPAILQIGSEIAEAVDAAHRKQVVHRDLKPANIMVTLDGHVKVMDFGLAKQFNLTGDSQADTFPGKLTSKGETPGTVSYMSPEQVRGEHLDARSDVFSLGVVLYKMATGKLPFGGATSGMTYDAILNRGPESPRSLNADVPSELEQLIQKALEKDPGDRYQTAMEILIELRLLGRTTDSDILASGDLRLGAPSEPKTSAVWTLAVSVAVLLAVAAVAALLWPSAAPAVGDTIGSLAVLPFDNARDDPDVDYLSDGIAENLINRLSQIEELQVMARSTSFRYRGPNVDPREVGKELEVRAVVTGRVMQQGETLNVQAELVDVETGTQLWGEQYRRDIADLVTVQNDIATEISNALRLELTGDEAEALAVRANSEAYQAYLMGRHLWNKRTNTDLKIAIELFERARERDPDYALAHVGLADCYTLLGGQFYGIDEDFPPDKVLPLARSAALEALRLDDALAEAHATLGFIRSLDWEWEEAENEYERAIALNPNYATAHQWYGQHLSFMGRYDDAIREHLRAVELDPASPLQNRQLGLALLMARDYEAAAEQLEKTLELDPFFSGVRENLAEIYWLDEKPDQAVSIVRESKPKLARFYELMGQEKNSEASAFLATTTDVEVPLSRRVVYYALAGDAGRAFEVFEDAVERRDPQLVRIVHEPSVDSIRSDPRFEELRRRMGLR